MRHAAPPSRRRFSPRHWHLETSLILTAAVLFFVLVLFTVGTYRETIGRERDVEVENAVALARMSAAIIDSFIQDLEGTTQTMALAIGASPAPISQESFGAYLSSTIKSFPQLRTLFITDLNGRVVASQRAEGVGTDLSSRPYVKALRAGRRTVWSDGLIGMQSGEVTVAYGRLIQAPDGTPRGYLLAAFYPSRLMARLPRDLPEDARVILTDHRGFVLHSTLGELRPEQHNVAANPHIREALRGRVVRAVGVASPFSSDRRYGAFVPIQTTGWVLGFNRPLAPLENQLRTIALRRVGLITAVMLGAILIFILIARRLIRPLARLADTAAAIAEGQRPTVPDLAGPAEVADLAAGMSAMSKAVAHREDTLHFLAEASKQLSASLDHETILGNLARLAVPSVADWCVIYLLNDDGTVRRLEVAHTDPAKLELVRRFAGDLPIDEQHPAVVVMRTGRSQLIPEITDEMIRAAVRSDETYGLVKDLGFRSAIIVPMITRGQAVGAISLATAESGRGYTQADLVIAEGLAHRASLAVDNARMYARQRGIAETLQRSLLRKELPEMPGITVAARYIPARTEIEVGGDWYDVFSLPDGRIAMVMGDVAGRGVEAASIMGQLQHALRAYANEGHSPASIMERLNSLLATREMTTLIYMVVDPASWTVRFANAGHLPPLILTPDGRATQVEGGSPPLGGSPLTMYREEEHALRPGSTVMLYTDGLVEVRGESLDAGLERLVGAATAGPNDELEALLDRVLARLLGSEGSADDVAVLALHAAALDPARLSLRLPAAPSSLPLLRHTLRRWLGQAGAGEAEIYEISVAASEACANSIEHAYQAADAHVEVEARLHDGEVSMTVRDWGRWREPRGTQRGRGLTLMRGLMDDVQVSSTDAGTTVQMRRRLKREVRA